MQELRTGVKVNIWTFSKHLGEEWQSPVEEGWTVGQVRVLSHPVWNADGWYQVESVFNFLKHFSEDCTHHFRTQRFKLAHVEPEVRKQAKDAILDFIRFLKITMTMLMLMMPIKVTAIQSFTVVINNLLDCANFWWFSWEIYFLNGKHCSFDG